MGKLQDHINGLVEAEYARGMNGAKIAQRLIEAGLQMMADEGGIHHDSRIVPNFDDDDFDGTFYIATRQDAPPSILLHTEGNFQFEASGRIFSIDDMRELVNAAKGAAHLFDDYARQHFDKQPPQINKAERNIEAALSLYTALGVDYTPPTAPTPQAIALKSSLAAAESVSAVDEPMTARILLLAIQASSQAETPIKGVQLSPDDLGVLMVLDELGYVLRDDLTDDLSLTMAGREKIGLRPEGLPDLPVDVEAITGEIRESELTARYLEGKVAGCERHIREGLLADRREHLEYVAAVIGEIAHEIRIGMHLPAAQIEGKIIPYNEDRDSGLRHADGLRLFFEDVHGRNVKAGWWNNIETGQPKLRNVGELLMLFVTEIWEAYTAYRDNANDDKLIDYPGLGVELADLGIRWADLCGALIAGRVATYSGVRNPGEEIFCEVGVLAERYERIRKTPEAVGEKELGDPMPGMDIAEMTDAKLTFNAKREDHKVENRLKEGGKKT